MSDSVIVHGARALMNILHPMTGGRASGTLTVTATVATTFMLKKGAWIFPALDGKQRPDLLFKVVENPATPDGSWTITDTPSAIPIISNNGGVRHNIAPGTTFAFDFPSADIMSMVLASIDTPAIEPVLNCSIKDLVLFEQMETQFNVDLRRSAIKRFPAAVIVWDSLTPADGSSVDTLNRRSKVGTRSALYRVNYQFSIFSSRGDSDNRRRTEGLSLLDEMMRFLTDRRMTDDGDCLSSPGGVQVLSAFRDAQAQQNFQKYYVYGLDVATTVSMQTTDTRVYNPWLIACMSVDKSGNPQLAHTRALRLVDGVCIDMDGNAVQIPYNAILADNGLPILHDDGNFILFAG